MTPLHTLIVAVDFSETSDDALDAALELARHRNGRVHLVHAWPTCFTRPGWSKPQGSISRRCSVAGPKRRSSGW